MAKFGMSDKHREVLRKNRVYLIGNILPTYSLFNQLQADEVLCEDLVETILAQPTRRGKISTLLDLVTRRGPKALPNLIKALVISRQFNTACYLEDAVQKVNIIIMK